MARGYACSQIWSLANTSRLQCDLTCRNALRLSHRKLEANVPKSTIGDEIRKPRTRRRVCGNTFPVAQSHTDAAPSQPHFARVPCSCWPVHPGLAQKLRLHVQSICVWMMTFRAPPSVRQNHCTVYPRSTRTMTMSYYLTLAQRQIRD